MARSMISLLFPIAALVVFNRKSIAFSILSLNNSKRRHRHHPPSLLSSSLSSSSSSSSEEEECLLIPEANPNSDPNTTSLSGVSHSAVISGIDALYPPKELSNRNARSRTDGYWKYVERGERPPQEFTYGEFDIDFFGLLLDRAWEIYSEGMSDDDDDDDDDEVNVEEDVLLVPWWNKTFCDIGSGAGRLVFSAAALHPEWKACRGLEILEGLHNMSTSILDGCRHAGNDDDAAERRRPKTADDVSWHDHFLRVPHRDDDDMPTTITTCTDDESHRDAEYLPLAPIEFTCGSFTDPYEYLGDIDCAFVFSSCMKPDLVKELSIAIGRQCKPGTIIITTEFPLFLRGSIEPLEGEDNDESPSSKDDSNNNNMPHGPYEIQLLEKIDGWCWLLGGQSTAYVHMVKTSLWKEYGGPREAPQLSLEEEAFRLVQSMENGELTDPKEFLRRVRNDMIFHGVPHEFLPEIEEGRE